MVYQQNRNVQLVGELLQLSYLVVVVGVRDVGSAVSYDLKCIDGDQRRVCMLCNEAFDLLAESIGKRSGRRCKESVGRHLAGDAVGPLLYAAERIFKAEIQRRASARRRE